MSSKRAAPAALRFLRVTTLPEPPDHSHVFRYGGESPISRFHSRSSRLRLAIAQACRSHTSERRSQTIALSPKPPDPSHLPSGLNARLVRKSLLSALASASLCRRSTSQKTIRSS